MPGSHVEVRRQRRRLAAGAGRDHADLARGSDLLDREPELCRHLARIGRTDEVPPGAPALGEVRARDLDHERRALAEREGIPPRRGDQHYAVRALVDRAQHASALGRGEVLEAVDAEQRTLERGGQARVGERVGSLELARREQHHRGPRRRGYDCAGVRPVGHERQSSVRGQQQPEPFRCRGAARQIFRGDVAQGCAGGRVGEIDGAEQESGEPVGDLHLPVGERGRRLGGQQADRAAARERRTWSETRQHLVAGHALVRDQIGRQAGAGQLAGDVVVQVGVQAAEPGLQLGRRAQREDDAVDRSETEALDGERQRRRRGRLAPVGRERERLFIGDVEAAQRVVRVGAARDRCLYRCPQACIEEREAIARCRERRLRPPARVRPPVATPSAAHSAARRAAGRRAPVRG